MEKPNYLKVDIMGIPQELIESDQWILWHAVFKKNKKKWDKVPIDANTLAFASATNPKTWSKFTTAYEVYNKSNGKFDGLGFVLSENDGLVGFDLDHCVKNKNVDPGQATIIGQLKSYTEYSPSQHGIRIFCFGSLPPKGRKKGDFECYETGRYLTVTGHRVPGSLAYVRNASDVIPEVHASIFKTTDNHKNDTTPHCSFFSDDEIIKKIQCSHQNLKFSDLFELGEWSGRYPSQSEADLGLCSILAFWCNRDAAQIDRIFRRSSLMRDKWDEIHGHNTYGNITIETAIKKTEEVYKPKAPNAGDITQNEIKTALDEDEDGDAGIYMRIFRDRLLFDHAGDSWYRWQDHYWEMDKLDEHIRNVDSVIHTYQREQNFLFKMMQDKARIGGDVKRFQEIIDMISKRVKALHKRDRKIKITDLSTKGAQSLGITGEEWDLDPWILGCANGIVDLKTGRLRPGEPSDQIRTVAPVNYSGINAECPKWQNFINTVFDWDNELILFVQRVLGYSILGTAIEHILPILWGSGRNGKGTLLEVLGRVLGDLSQKAEGELMLKQRVTRQAGAPNSAISDLRGRRLVWCSEVGEGRVFDVARVKELVGGDTLSAREPYARRAVEFRPSHTLFLLTNSKPHADASDYAFWARVHLIPFNVSFVDTPTAKNEKQADKNLITTLFRERSGILSWLVRGCLSWQKEGLNPPEKVKAATANYQQEEDIIGLWISECCEVGLCEDRAKNLYASYKSWADENGCYKYSKTAFGKYLREKKFDSRLSAGTIYMGIKVLKKEKNIDSGI